MLNILHYRKRQLKKAQQMSEMRLSLEQKKAERWAKLQHSMEAVRQRREARLLEMKRRREAEEKSSSSDAVDSNILPMSAHSQIDHTLISSSTKVTWRLDKWRKLCIFFYVFTIFLFLGPLSTRRQ